MDPELDQAVQSCLDLLQALPVRLDQQLSQVVANYSELEDRFKAKEATLVAELSDLDSKLQEIKSSQHTERLRNAKLSAELQRLKDERLQLDAEVSRFLSVLRESAENSPQLTAEDSEQRAAKVREELEYLGSKLSLYCNCTRIRWDYDQTNAVAGQVLNKSDNRTFQIPLQPAQKELSFDQINQLWELMD